MCAMEFRSVNDVIPTYIITTLYWIGKSLFSQRLRTFMLSSSTRFPLFDYSLVAFIRFGLLCAQLAAVHWYNCVQRLSYEFMCRLCMYACTTHHMQCKRCTEMRPNAIIMWFLLLLFRHTQYHIDIMHSQFSHSTTHFLLLLSTAQNSQAFFMMICIAHTSRTKGKAQPLRSCCSAIHKTKNEKGSQ